MSLKRALQRFIGSRWLSLFVRIILGSVFIYAGFIKLIDPKAFARVISLYDIVPENLLPFIAIGLPAIEFLAGLGLVLNVRGSLTTIFALLLMFSAVLAYGILHDLNIDCGCFTPEEINQRDGLKVALYRDLIMIGGAFWLFLSKLSRPLNTANQSLLENLRNTKRRS